MRNIGKVLSPGPEALLEEWGSEEFKKTQQDPEYLITNYLMEAGDQLVVTSAPHPRGEEIHYRVTEPSGRWTVLKYVKEKR